MAPGNSSRKRPLPRDVEHPPDEHATKFPAVQSTTKSTPSEATIAGACVLVQDRYEKLGRIGRGTYGIVYKARDLETRTVVALKRCIPHHVAMDGFPVHFLREIANLRLCAPCQHIVSLLTVAVSKSTVFLVFEYCEHDLSNLIDQYAPNPFSEETVKTMMIHLLKAVAFMHAHHLMHRDLKASNLLYTNAGLLKVADFGLSRHCPATPDQHLTSQVASLWYRPPEILLHCDTYTQAIDLWAVGCLFSELLTGMPALPGRTEPEQIDRLFRYIGTPDQPHLFPDLRHGRVPMPNPQGRKFRLLETHHTHQQQQHGTHCLSDAGSQLLTCLLQWDPAQRWTAVQALRTPYLWHESPLPLTPREMPRFPAVEQQQP